MMFSVETTIMFVSYSALMIFIGFYFYKKNKNVEDYFLGGRSMGPVVSALSAGASDMSGWLLMGLPGALYVAGYIEAYIAVGLIAGATLNWLFVAKRLRVYTSVIANSITIPDYFETRFDDDKHILRIVCAIIILIFFTLYVSSGLVGGAKLFESTFGIQYDYALAVGVLIIVAYTFLGGYKAVCWTDMIQGFLMLVALIVVPFVMLSKIGGFDQVAKYINQSDDSSLQIIQIQTKIPSVIQNIESSQSQEIVAVLIHLLENSNDRVLGEKNIQKEYQKDSVVLNIFGGDLKSSIFPKDIALKLKMALEQKDYSTLSILLQGISKISFAFRSRLNWFEGVSFVSIISALAWGIGYFGQPHILVRFMSIRSTKDIPIATIIGISWMTLCLIGSCLIGLLGIAYINKFNLSLDDPEKIFIIMSQTLFNPWVAGILLSAILAAIMSTASSQLLVASSTIAEDFYRKIFKKDASSSMVLNLGKVGVLIVASVAFFISTDKNSNIFGIVTYAWAGFGASFGSVVLFSLFWNRMTRVGAIAGMLTGALVVIGWKNLISQYWDIYEIIPGFIAASIVIVIVSLLTNVRVGTKIAYEKMLKTL